MSVAFGLRSISAKTIRRPELTQALKGAINPQTEKTTRSPAPYFASEC